MAHRVISLRRKIWSLLGQSGHAEKSRKSEKIVPLGSRSPRRHGKERLREHKAIKGNRMRAADFR
jgi:hypothetical protein